MKVTVISPFCVEVEQSETEWLHDRLQSSMSRAAVLSGWTEKSPLPWWAPSYCSDMVEEPIVDLVYEGSWNCK